MQIFRKILLIDLIYVSIKIIHLIDKYFAHTFTAELKKLRTIMKNKLLVPIFSLMTGLAVAQQKQLTTNAGAPVGDNQDSKKVGQNGPVLLEDIHLVEKLAAFDRERIPERVVHARGAGAYGEFVAEAEFSQYTIASLFSQKGKTTPVFVRFSTVMGGSASPETIRDPRGFATKFYTDQGNY